MALYTCRVCDKSYDKLNFSQNQIRNKSASQRVCKSCIFRNSDLIPISSMTRKKSITKLTQWIRKNGANLTDVKLDWNQRPILTITKTTSPGKPIIRIPKACILTDRIVHTSPYNTALSTILNQQKHKLVHRLSLWAVFLLQSLSNPNSEWFCYISALPKYHSDIPVLWKTKHQELLVGTLTYEVLLGNLEAYYRDYTILRIIGRVPFEFRDYLWAMITVTRGIFRLPMDGQPQGAMVPGLGDLGRENTINTKWWYDVQSENMIVQTNKWLLKGSKLSMGCGAKCNSILANNYGFVVKDNPNTETLLSINMQDIRPDETDEIRQGKYDLLGRRQNYDNGTPRFELRNQVVSSVIDRPVIHFQIKGLSPDDYSRKTPFVYLLGALRVLFLDTCPLNLEPSDFVKEPTKFLDIQNERQVFQLLSTVCESRLEKLGTARQTADESKAQSDTPSIISDILDSEFRLMEEISRMCKSISRVLNNSLDLQEISLALETHPCSLVESYWSIYWKCL